jgi:hypothetical protein
MPEAHLDGLPALRPLVREVVRREVIAATRQRVIHERVMRRNHESAARHKHAMELAQGRCPVAQVVHDERREHGVEGAGLERQRLAQVGSSEARTRGQPVGRQLDHRRTAVNTGDDGLPFNERSGVGACPASGVENAEPGDVAQQRQYCRALVQRVPRVGLVVARVRAREPVVGVLAGTRHWAA